MVIMVVSKEIDNSTKRLRFKANFRPSKAKFDSKVIAHKVTVQDGLDNRFRSFITIYCPKLKPNQTKSCVILHIGNGNSTCFFRVKNPDALVGVLQDLIITLKSREWTEKWWKLEDISENIQVNNLVMDEMFIDINEWNHALQDTIKWEITAKEDFVSRGD